MKLTIFFPRVHDDVPKHPPVFTAWLLINSTMYTSQKPLYTDTTQLLPLLACIFSCYDRFILRALQLSDLTSDMWLLFYFGQK